MSLEKKSNSLSRVFYEEFDVYLELYQNRIDIFEASTGKFLKNYQLSDEKFIQKLISANPEDISWIGKGNKTISVILKMLELRSTILTTDQYIFSIQYDLGSELGAHFGFYGWGLFTIKSNEIHSLFSQETEKLMTGQFLKQGNKVQILLGYENGLIESYKIDSTADISKFNPEQGKLWKDTDEHGIRSIIVFKNMLISTHTEGYVKVRTLDSGLIVQSIKATGDKIMCITPDEKYCFIGTWDGIAAAVDTKNWEVIWKKKLSDQPIAGCTLLKDGLCYVDNSHSIFWVSIETGEVYNKIQSNIGVASAPIQLKKCLIVGGAGSLLVFSGGNCIENHIWKDNLIRAIHPLPHGVLIGNDDGYLSLWTSPGIKVY